MSLTPEQEEYNKTFDFPSEEAALQAARKAIDTYDVALNGCHPVVYEAEDGVWSAAIAMNSTIVAHVNSNNKLDWS